MYTNALLLYHNYGAKLRTRRTHARKQTEQLNYARYAFSGR